MHRLAKERRRIGKGEVKERQRRGNSDRKESQRSNKREANNRILSL